MSIKELYSNHRTHFMDAISAMNWEEIAKLADNNDRRNRESIGHYVAIELEKKVFAIQAGVPQ